MNDENQPKVRFKGFTDPWEQCKFNQLYIKNTERNGNKFESNRTISISKMKYKTAGNGAAAKSISNYKVLRVGDIAFEGHSSNDFSYGRFVLNDVGDGIMSPRFTTLRPKVNTNIQFWKYYIHYEPIMRRKLVKSTKLGTMMNELVTSDLFKQSITVPTEKEANKIGACLQGLSNLIAANQDKLDQLKEVKKLLMQKIFDQQWRFSGFTDPWEQRKLGKYFLERNTRAAIGNLISVTINDGVVEAKSIKRKDNSSRDKSNYKQVKINDIAYNSMRMWQGASGVSQFDGILSPAYTVLIPQVNVDSRFFGYSFKRRKQLNVFQKYSQGLTSDTWNLKYPQLKQIDFFAPIVSEQKKISELLISFDYLIAANQDKVDQLKEMKKWLMQNMFV